MHRQPRILVVNSEPAAGVAIRDFLQVQRFKVDEAADCRRAVVAFRKNRPDAVILDNPLPDGDAMLLIRRFREMDGNVPALVLVAPGCGAGTDRETPAGDIRILEKPVEFSTILGLLEKDLGKCNQTQERTTTQQHRERATDYQPFIGTSILIRQLEEQARKVLETASSVLIWGETGAGKGVMARWLHRNGPRARERFVDLNCAGFARELLESELFGHERGAFTGATHAKPGLFEMGDHGTVFLDEIGDMDLDIQPKLLTVLEEKRFRRIGELRDREVDVRLIASTHQDLPQLIQEKKFRSDLYFRISTVTLAIPPLRERAQDIPAIARCILDELAQRLRRGKLGLSPQAADVLRNYSWPGNIRELRNVLERSLLFNPTETLLPNHLQFGLTPAMGRFAGDLNLPLAEVERLHIERVLAAEHGHVKRAAAKLGIPRSSLYDKIKRFHSHIPGPGS